MKKSYFLMLMALAFLLQGCSTENMNDEAASIGSINKFQLSSKRISLDESKHKLQLLPEISEAKTMLKSMKSNVSGKVIDYGNGTSIDTNDVIYIENGPNYHTYTFNIIRENAPANAPLENLVLSPLSDGTYREILVSYYITDQEKEILRSGGTVDTKNKVTYQSLETGSFQSGITSKTQDCHLEINFYYTECSENLHSHGEQYPKCKADQPSELVYVITEVCTDTSGGSDNPWDPNFPDLPGGGGGGEGGGSTTPCNGNGVLTGPQTPASGIGYDSGDGCTGIPTSPNLSSTFSLYINSLPLNLKDLLTNPMNTDFYNGLSNYFYANNGSNDAKISIAWAAQYKSNNPTTTWQQFLNWFMYDIHITTDMDARVKCILQKMAGDTNISDDKITLPITPASDNLFQKMLRMFNGNNAPRLTFKYDPNLPATGAYASTKSYDGGASYEIVLGADMLQSSNIRIMTILAHELTHAFMLNDLTQLNMIEWYNDGTAHISTGNAQNACNQNDFFSNNPDHYFANLLCLYMTNSPSSLNQWQHEIFETPTFDINSYIQKLTNYVKNNHDWNSESASWTSSMQTYYGNNWKYEVALNLQMDGIRQTSHFASWSNKTPTQFHNEIVSIIDNGHLPNTNNSYPANKNCN